MPFPVSAADIFDVLVLGAGPAGSTAAATLAKAGRTVCLIDADEISAKSLPPRGGPGWISAQCLPILTEIGLTPKDVDAVEIKTVAFCDAHLAKIAHPNPDRPVGYLVDRATLAHRLIRNAAAAGADVRLNTRIDDIALEEQHVTLKTHDPSAPELRGRLLVLAAGRGTGHLNWPVETTGLAVDQANPGWSSHVHTEQIGRAHV